MDNVNDVGLIKIIYGRVNPNRAVHDGTKQRKTVLLPFETVRRVNVVGDSFIFVHATLKYATGETRIGRIFYSSGATTFTIALRAPIPTVTTLYSSDSCVYFTIVRRLRVRVIVLFSKLRGRINYSLNTTRLGEGGPIIFEID